MQPVGTKSSNGTDGGVRSDAHSPVILQPRFAGTAQHTVTAQPQPALRATAASVAAGRPQAAAAQGSSTLRPAAPLAALPSAAGSGPGGGTVIAWPRAPGLGAGAVRSPGPAPAEARLRAPQGSSAAGAPGGVPKADGGGLLSDGGGLLGAAAAAVQPDAVADLLTTPLLGTCKDVALAAHPADVMFVLPLDDKDESTVDGEAILGQCFQKDAEQYFLFTAKACRQAKPMLKDVREAFQQDLHALLPSCGFSVKSFKSVDEDELFLRVDIRNPDVSEFYATKFSMRLQTTNQLTKALEIDQPEDASPGFVVYDQAFVDNQRQHLGHSKEAIFRMYFGTNESGTIFRQVDRIRIIYQVMNELVDLGCLTKFGVVVTHFPVHIGKSLCEFKYDWSSFWPRRLLDLSVWQPLDHIKDYFGELVAFYYVWAGFTIKLFIHLAVVAVVVALFNTFSPLDKQTTRLISYSVFGLFMVAWSSFYQVLWQRLEYWYRVKWDMLDADTRSTVRPDFQGELKPSPLDRSEMERQDVGHNRARSRLASSSIMLLFFITIVAGVSFAYWLRDPLIRRFGEQRGVTYQGYYMGVQIQIINTAWGWIAPWLVHLENPRTDLDYQKSLVWKQFLIQSFNSYNAFVYTAFAQRYLHGNCPHDDCLDLLSGMLYGTMKSLAIMSFVSNAISYFQVNWAMRQEEAELARAKEGDLAGGLAAGAKALVDRKGISRSFMEKQGKMSEYTIDDQVADYVELVIIIGYVPLFCVAAPGSAILALLVVAVLLRCKAWKLCSVIRRPFPTAADGIGDWNTVISLLSWAGVLSSVAIPLVNLKHLDSFSVFQKLLLFFVIEHILVAVRIVVNWCLPKESDGADLMLKRRRVVADALMKGGKKSKSSHGGLPSSLRAEPPQSFHLSQCLTCSSDEWQFVEKEEDVRRAAEAAVLRTNRDDCV